MALPGVSRWSGVRETPFLSANEPVGTYWEDVLDDAELVSRAYRDQGWDVTVLEPRDVSPTPGERFGLTVLLTDDAYATLEDVLSREPAAVTDLELSRRSVRDVVFLLLVERDPTNEVAVVLPVYYFIHEAEPVFERASEAGVLPIHCRPRSSTAVITVSHAEPSLFGPGPDRRGTAVDDVVTVRLDT